MDMDVHFRMRVCERKVSMAAEMMMHALAIEIEASSAEMNCIVLPGRGRSEEKFYIIFDLYWASIKLPSLSALGGQRAAAILTSP